MTDVKGSCFCGEVKYSIEAPSKWSSHCHCTMCQRAHGAAFVTFVGYNEADVAIDDAGSHLGWFHSSDHARRGFCRQCGSMMFFKSTNWPGELHITRASMLTTPDREPEGHSYYDTHVDWVQLGDELPR